MVPVQAASFPDQKRPRLHSLIKFSLSISAGVGWPQSFVHSASLYLYLQSVFALEYWVRLNRSWGKNQIKYEAILLKRRFRQI